MFRIDVVPIASGWDALFWAVVGCRVDQRVNDVDMLTMADAMRPEGWAIPTQISKYCATLHRNSAEHSAGPFDWHRATHRCTGELY